MLAFTRCLFGEDKLLRFDMSECQTQEMLDDELAFLAEKGIALTAVPAVLPFLIQRGLHGARPMRDARGIARP